MPQLQTSVRISPELHPSGALPRTPERAFEPIPIDRTAHALGLQKRLQDEFSSEETVEKLPVAGRVAMIVGLTTFLWLLIGLVAFSIIN